MYVLCRNARLGSPISEAFLCDFPQFSLCFSSNANPVTPTNDEILTIREVSELLKINDPATFIEVLAIERRRD